MLKKENFSELKVLQSAAGYFIGRLYWDDEYNFWDMGCRLTDYFATREQAEQALKEGFIERYCSENEWGRANGLLP